MSSDAKTQANRDNSKLSTGPKTEEGKARSSQNSRTHGLNSATLFIPEERQPEFQSLVAALLEEVLPVGELQSLFFEQLVHASWQQQIARTMLVHAQMTLDQKGIALAHRYIGQYERSFARALKEIKTLQTDLALRTIEQNQPIADLPATVDIKVVTREATQIARSAERTQREAVRHGILMQIGYAYFGVEAPSGEPPVPEHDSPLPDANLHAA
jgi:hypothetical protein